MHTKILQQLIIYRRVWHMSILKVFLIQIFEKCSVWEKKRRPRHRDFLPVLLKVDILK